MRAAIFDIDGTLTRTNLIDNACYIRTVQGMVDFTFTAFEEESFPHFTDSCIIQEIYKKYRNRLPSWQEESNFKAQYLKELQDAYNEKSANFQAVEGAKIILSFLKEKGWAVGLATGCWIESAKLKTRLAGISIQNFPIATASDAITREDIVRLAMARIQEATPTKITDWVYIGDGIWDFKTCSNLKMPFVGIDAEKDFDKRTKLGAAFKLENYNNTEQVLAVLEAAVPPVVV